MKNLITLFTVLLLLSCGNNNSPQPPKGEDIDTVIPPPPKPIDSVPVIDPIIPPPPPPVEDTIAPPPVVEVPDPVKKPEDNNYILALNYYKIVEGRVTDAQALQNRFGLKQAFVDAKSVGIDTFKIGKVDVYFDVSTVTSETNKNFYPSVEGINIPSDFNLVMSDETYLRVQPNNSAKYSLLVFDENKKNYVSGGHLIGDRLEHKWSGKGSDEWGHLLDIMSGQNITIDNVEAKHGNGDGLVIHANEFTWKSNYVPTKGILIKNSRFIENRRQGISIVDTQGTTIDGCHFGGTGKDLPGSNGTNPQFAIDVEPYRERDEVTGKVHEYEKVSNVIIRNCTEVGSKRGGFIFKAGDNILIENNTLESGIVIDHVTNTTARNNTLINTDPNNNRLGIGLGSTSEFSHNNSAIGNVIQGYSQGIRVGGEGSKVHDNKISDFISGIVIKNAINAEVYDNHTASERPTSIALFAHSTYAENVRIYANYFRGGRSAAQFTTINRNGQNGKITVDNNTFDNTQAVTFDRVNNAEFLQNTVLGAITVRMTDGLSLIENEVLSTSYGIQLREGNGLITIKENTIPNAWGCVDIKVQPEELVREGNCPPSPQIPLTPEGGTKN
jgi:small nuclear ribonucleoprotein (snRNP)-like protein